MMAALCFLLSPLLLAAWANGNSVEQKIYVELRDTAACVRLMNGTHQIGCQSSVGGDTGVLHLVSDPSDLAWILTDGPHSPYMALLHDYMFSRETMMQLKASRGRVAGVVVILNQEVPPSAPVNLSHDLSCPNDRFGVYEDTEYSHCRRAVWNPSGTGLALEDFSFPVFMLRDANETSAVLQCVREHNVPRNGTSKAVQYPLCAIQLKSHMHGVRDTVTCMRRSQLFNNLNPELVCDSLGDYNVLGVLQPINQSEKGNPGKDFVIAAARLDSRSFFWNVTSGADSATSGFVTLLAAAQALAALGNASLHALPRNVLFLFLQGEAFDYIGSSRFVYDMMHNQSFLSLDSIHSFLEISQVGLRDGGTVWAHSDPVSRQAPGINESVGSMVDDLRMGGLPVTTPDPEQPLPPSSLQRFLRHRNLTGVVLAEHRTAFLNQYYHSVYDVAPNIELRYPAGLTPEQELTYPTDIAKNLTELATGVARALYLQAGGNKTDIASIQANTTTVARLLYTLLVQTNNSWLRSIMDKENKGILGRRTLSFYVGVSENWSHNEITQVVLHALANLTGTAVPLNETACRDPKKHGVADDEMYKYIWAMDAGPDGAEGAGFCSRSTAHLGPAVSPAFQLRDFSSREFSTWTESRWKQLRARLFLVASPRLEHVTLAVGCLVLALSLASVYLVDAKADVLFTPARDAHSPAY